MTTSTNGQICFGIFFEEGFQFPWDKNGDEIDDWWIYTIHGFKHSFQLYDNNGNYLNGIKPSNERIAQYYAEKREFEKTIPDCSVCLVNCCSCDYPMYILALKDSCLCARRGYPESFNPEQLKIKTKVLLDFCEKYGIEHENEPKWYLSSYWG